jgi:hypothetical protein
MFSSLSLPSVERIAPTPLVDEQAASECESENESRSCQMMKLVSHITANQQQQRDSAASNWKEEKGAF